MLAAKNGTTTCEVFRVSVTPATAQQIDRKGRRRRLESVGSPTAVYGDGDAIVNLGTLVDNTYAIRRRQRAAADPFRAVGCRRAEPPHRPSCFRTS